MENNTYEPKLFLKRAWAEIHLDRLEYNLNQCKGLLRGDTKMLCVVKANAYGHSDNIVAPFLEKCGVRWFAVSNVNEALHIRKVCTQSEILILGYTPEDYAPELFNNNIIQTVGSYEFAKDLSLKVKSKDQKVKVHIKLDTGMGRIGLKFSNCQEYVDEIIKICSIENIVVDGIFTHLSVADSSDKSDIEYTEKQIKLIKQIAEELKGRNINIPNVHFLNSAGATYYPDDKSSLARFGIMLYGLYPNKNLELPITLKPVMELKTVVSNVKTVDEDSFISYGRTYKALKGTKVATLTIGYADGYSRLLSNKAEVLLNGKRVKIIGKVCMDQLMVDVTNMDVKVGDVATLFGNDGDESITADDLAQIYGTIGYEIICGISKRVPRVIYKNGNIVEVVENY